MQNAHIRASQNELLFCGAVNYIAMHMRSAGAQAAPTEVHMSIKSISNWFGAWKRYRVAVRELEQLSDRELSDLGIVRGEIDLIARQSAGL